MQSYDPQELVHVSGGEYTTKTHDSLRISNGFWNWCSQGIGGKTALDYLIKVKGFSFLEAVEQIVGHTATTPPVYIEQKGKAPKVLLLPKINRYATNMVSYLERNRGIDSDIVDFCIRTGRVYESYPHHNVVFVGFDNEGGQPYWSWYGFGGRVEWCACFVSWCADQCGYIETGIIPKFAACTSQGMLWFKDRGQWQDGSYTPKAGDIIFFDWDGNGTADHVGIVEKVENGKVHTVEGNSGDACKQRNYDIGSAVIIGYGIPQY